MLSFDSYHRFSIGGKAAGGRDAGHLPACSDEDKNKWNFPYTVLVLFMVCAGTTFRLLVFEHFFVYPYANTHFHTSQTRNILSFICVLFNIVSSSNKRVFLLSCHRAL